MEALNIKLSLLLYFVAVNDAQSTEPLVVNGDQIYKSVSNVVWAGKGVNLPDTRACGFCTRSKDEVMRRVDYIFDVLNLDWIRLTLEADDNSETVINNVSYWQDVQDIISYIGSKPGKYVEASLFKDPSIGADSNVPNGPSGSTRQEWVKMAKVFKDQPHVIIGIVNEPNGTAASLIASMNYVVEGIRGVGAQNLILVQCLGYSADCNLYKDNRISDSNTAYEIHVYSTASQTDDRLLQGIPLVVSETAVESAKTYNEYETMSDYLHLVDLCAERGIPYAGWSFDEECGPAMLNASASDSNSCGLDNDLSSYTAWGNLFLRNVSCNGSYCNVYQCNGTQYCSDPNTASSTADAISLKVAALVYILVYVSFVL